MRRRSSEGSHLVDHHVMPALGELPRGLAAREAASRNVNGLVVFATFSAQRARHGGMIARAALSGSARHSARSR